MPRTIKQQVVINAPSEEVYKALMDSKTHAAFSGAKARVSQKVGGKFNCYDGYIEGYNLELEENKRIIQAWRGSDWKAGEWSVVDFKFKKRGKKKTEITLQHLAVPDVQVKGISKGWKEHYWDKLNEYFTTK